jgi:hypothetical protein
MELILFVLTATLLPHLFDRHGELLTEFTDFVPLVLDDSLHRGVLIFHLLLEVSKSLLSLPELCLRRTGSDVISRLVDALLKIFVSALPENVKVVHFLLETLC